MPAVERRSEGLEALRDIVRKVWGYDEFRPLQSDAIEAVLAGVRTSAGGNDDKLLKEAGRVFDGLHALHKSQQENTNE